MRAWKPLSSVRCIALLVENESTKHAPIFLAAAADHVIIAKTLQFFLYNSSRPSCWKFRRAVPWSVFERSRPAHMARQPAKQDFSSSLSSSYFLRKSVVPQFLPRVGVKLFWSVGFQILIARTAIASSSRSTPPPFVVSHGIRTIGTYRTIRLTVKTASLTENKHPK
jgi:hypothetical protein